MPACCQHLPLKHWWDEGTHAGGVKGWRGGWTEVEKKSERERQGEENLACRSIGVTEG